MFKGMIVAIVTPFNKENQVDYDALRNHVSWLVEEGVDGIVACGTTGETPTLSDEEQFNVLKETLTIAKGKTPIIMGTGCNDTRKTVEKTLEAKKAGADGCLLIVPYYNRPTPEGCIAHFQEVGKLGFPMIPYHHPGRTGIKLNAETWTRIAEIPEVAAIKEGPGDIELTRELRQQTDKPILSGADELMIPMMTAGAEGVISVIGNLIPRQWRQFISICLAGEYEAARRIFDRYSSLINAMFLETNPQCVKYALSLMGKCGPGLRLPLLEPRESTKTQIKESIDFILPKRDGRVLDLCVEPR